MDFFFEDEADDVGSDVEAYCPKCRADTTHVVISKYEDEIRRVQCNPCGDVHSYRKPRGEVEDDIPEPVAAKKRASLKKVTWEEFFAKHNEKSAKPYEFREHYRENVMVTHPKFGVGFVSEVVSDSKVEITFKDGRRILVHNRKDIAGLPLAAEGDGTPTPAGGKAQKAKAAPKADAKPGKPGKDEKREEKEEKEKAPELVAVKPSKADKPAKPVAVVKPAPPAKAVKAAKPAAKAAAKAPVKKAPKPAPKAKPAAKARPAAKAKKKR
jgi:hypothetical protein